MDRNRQEGENNETEINLATGNEHKMKEIREILDESKYEIISMKEAGVDIDIVEDGKTFEENALIKAKAVMEITGQLTLADDSGLEIDALNGEPGIYSSRYLGEDTSYVKKNSVILERLKRCTRREEVQDSFVRSQLHFQMDKRR